MKKSEPGGSSLHIRVLDGDALKKLSTEPNSSKYVIDAHNRGIEDIRDLSELPKLCALDLSFNKLKSLKNLQTTKELREVKAYNNQLTTLRGVRGNGNLEGLLVHENQLEEIAEDLLSLPKLKSLWLNSNRITSVQHLTACRLLVHLDLSRNRLTGVAASGLDSLSSLEYLNLSDNQLTSIGNLTHLAKLEELNIAGNRLVTLDGTLLPTSLTVLRLNGNQLTSLASLPPNMTALNELYVHDNVIATLGDSLVTSLPQIESLDLRGNRIKSTVQLKPWLTGCSTLMDLWLQGNPCCLSSTYLLDTIALLPELKTLDNLSDTQLKLHIDALKSGAITQDALLASLTRPSTASRPGSASLRSRTPSTSGGSRPGTPDRSTGTGAPVFHRQSSRTGALLKVASASELEKAHADVVDRLEKMRAMLGRIGTKDAAVKTTTSKTAPQAKSQFREQPPSASNRVENKSNQEMPRPVASAANPVKCGVDAGTDPLESLIGNSGKLSARVTTPEIITPRQGMETQTQTLPPAPVHLQPVTMNRSRSSTSTAMDATIESDNNQSVEGQINGELLEKEMKEMLTKFANTPDDDSDMKDMSDQPQDDRAEVIESPRIESNKLAQRRVPPNPRSRQGYRAFRVPARLMASPETAMPTNAV